MREIKFRAWNPEMDRYEYSGVVQFDGSIVSDWGADKYDWIVEQFTGLRDKKGKEIYEGDILAGTLGTAGRGASTRREKPFNFQMMWYREGWNLSAVDRYCSSTYRWYPNADDCTIIGNIHENSELLK